MEWMHEDSDSHWTCEYCEDKNLKHARNCTGGEDQGFKIKVYDEIYHQCPLGVIDEDAWEVVSIIQMCEGGGFGASMLPSLIMDETQFWWNVRSIIVGEQNKIEKFNKPKDNVK